MMTAEERTVVNPKDGAKITSPYSDVEVIGALRKIRKPSDFAQSLIRQFDDRGLTSAQLFWAHKIAVEEDERVARVMSGEAESSVRTPDYSVPLADEGFAAIKGLFAHAAEKLKYPKIRFYVDDDHQYQLSVAGPSARYPGTVNVVTLDRTWLGRIFEVDAKTWFYKSKVCPDDVVDILQSFSEDPITFAGEYGRQVGQCCFCRIPLTDPRSLEAGYGPVCAKNWGLPWGGK